MSSNPTAPAGASRSCKQETFLALDLELNQPSGRIIQVGIALGGRLQPQADYFTQAWLLDPGEPIAPEIEALTGISDQLIASQAVPWAQMVTELHAILAAQPHFVNPVSWGGGDATTLLAEIASRELSFPHFGRRWLDVKTMHSLLSFATDKNPAGGLSRVMGRYGLPFIGKAHRADVDAFNTLRLFFRLLGRQSDLETAARLFRQS